MHITNPFQDGKPPEEKTSEEFLRKTTYPDIPRVTTSIHQRGDEAGRPTEQLWTQVCLSRAQGQDPRRACRQRRERVEVDVGTWRVSRNIGGGGGSELIPGARRDWPQVRAM